MEKRKKLCEGQGDSWTVRFQERFPERREVCPWNGVGEREKNVLQEQQNRVRAPAAASLDPIPPSLPNHV